MGQSVANKTSVQMKQQYPSIVSSLKDHPIKGYNDSLSAAYITISTTYLNHVEFFFKKKRAMHYL